MRRPVRTRGSVCLAAAGFSLVELIVVVMILGIIASIAAPKLLGTSRVAVDNGLRHTLAVIREAIDRFAAEYPGKLPGEDGDETTFKNEIAPYLRGPEFPICPVGAKNNRIQMMTGSDIAGQIAATSSTHSWLYNYGSGDFYVNSAETAADEATTYDQF